MTVFNKRNALVGYVTLKALERRGRRRQLRRNAPKIALFSILGLASLGIAVGLGAVLLRRRGDSEIDAIHGSGEELESEIVGEYVTASSEPIPAT